jgi:hypothetical protein
MKKTNKKIQTFKIGEETQNCNDREPFEAEEHIKHNKPDLRGHLVEVLGWVI